MTPATPIPKLIADVAMDWILRCEEGLSPADRHAFDQWRLADPRHEEALARLQGLLRELDAVPPTQLAPSLAVPTAVARTPTRRWPWAMAASFAFLCLLGNAQWLSRLGADYSTGVGERRTVHLADGSVVEMDSDTVLDQDYAAGRRTLKLRVGRAMFVVKADPRRPFVVEAGNGSVTALGTRFIVATDGDESELVVTEHSVAARTGKTPAAVVVQGQAINWGPDGLERTRPVDLSASTAWMRGRLVVSGAPLREVVSEIGRYRKGYVRLMGDSGAIRVSGVYDLTHPDQALDALSRTLELRQVRLTDRFILLSR